MTIIFKKQEIKELSNNQLLLWLKNHKISRYRLNQIQKWIYFCTVQSFEEMTDISKDTRDLLSQNFYINNLQRDRIEESKDGSKKYVFQLNDLNFIETVLIPEKDYYTLCISSQIGCAQGCKFCMTAKMGFVRNLSKGEILSQILNVQSDLKKRKKLTNIVFMGMGEPLANYDNIIAAVNTITDTYNGLCFSKRRVTISTAGIVSKFGNLANDTNARLAVSLNASENSTRDILMPINKKYPIETLIAACKSYPLKPRDSITFEYVLLRGINDSEDDAQRTAKLLIGIKAKVNLIPFNEHKDSGFERPEEDVIFKFQEILRSNKVTAIIRDSKGRDISAACGQLAGTA